MTEENMRPKRRTYTSAERIERMETKIKAEKSRVRHRLLASLDTLHAAALALAEQATMAGEEEIARDARAAAETLERRSGVK